MAKLVKMPKGKEFTFKSGGGQGSKYPWDTWFNGDLLMLEQSEGGKDDKGTVTQVTAKKDFEVDTDAMPAKIKTAARRRYKVVQISLRDADGKRLENALIVRARDMDDTERQEEDLLRAEERDESKERKEEDKAARKQLIEEGTKSPTRQQITVRRQLLAAKANGQPAGTPATRVRV